jgi:hypothetical protein
MLTDFRNQIKEALTKRSEAVLPGVIWLIPVVFIFTLLFCLFSVYIVPSDKPADFNFQEGGTITAMSAIYLTLAAGFALAANLINIRWTGKQNWLWTILFLGFAFLAFDELMQFHERFDTLVMERLLPDIQFKGWNDLVVILYGVAAVPIMFLLLPKLLKYRHMLEIFIVGFVFYTIHTFIDSVQETATFTIVIFEESAKLLSVSFLSLGSLMGLIGNIWEYVPTHSTEKISSEENQLIETSGLQIETVKT